MAQTRNNDSEALDAESTDTEAADGAETPVKLDLDVKIDRKSACERHVTVTIPRTDVERYIGNAFNELVPKAEVPGFRQGRAPRKLVEVRFRKEVADQIKSSLLVDSMTQMSEENQLTPISEPDFDPASIVVPDDGPMTFEFDIEVRPEFDMPQWKGLNIDRPVRDFNDADVDADVQKRLTEHGKLIPHDGAAKAGDYIVANVTFKNGDETVSELKEQTIRIRPVLSFRDGTIESFDKLMKGVKAGDTKTGDAKLTEDAPNEAIRGKTIKAEFEVLEVKKLELPELTAAFLEEMGGFASEEELRKAIRENLDRRLKYEQQQRARQQVLASLTVAADWDLPPSLLKRQASRELERSILELRRSGFGDDEIRAHINDISQNSKAATAKSLKEHFILERIAEEEKIEDTAEDYDMEVELIAAQSGQSPRRVRAQLEKRGLMDALRNQIIERKAIELILGSAKFKDVPYKMEAQEAEALDEAAGGESEPVTGEVSQ